LVASILMISVPARAGEATRLRASIDRALEAPLTESERADLERRQAALRTDPVARGTGGIVMSLLATAASIGLTLYLLKKTKESLPPPTAMPSH
jgi:hypothetical protein